MKLVLNNQFRRAIIVIKSEKTPGLRTPRQHCKLINRPDDKGWRVLVYRLIDHCEREARFCTERTIRIFAAKHYTRWLQNLPIPFYLPVISSSHRSHFCSAPWARQHDEPVLVGRLIETTKGRDSILMFVRGHACADPESNRDRDASEFLSHIRRRLPDVFARTDQRGRSLKQ